MGGQKRGFAPILIIGGRVPGLPPPESTPMITGKESIQWERFFELAPIKGTRRRRYKLFKKRKGTLGQKFFSARVVDLWNELDDSTVSVGYVTVFKRKLGKLGY